jgi:hypothetical protein
MTCVFRSSDTLLTVASAGGDSVRLVTRVWPTRGRRKESYDMVERSLQQIYGRGKKACPAAHSPPGRYWQASGYYIILNSIAGSDSLYLTYVLGQPKYEPGCSS